MLFCAAHAIWNPVRSVLLNFARGSRLNVATHPPCTREACSTRGSALSVLCGGGRPGCRAGVRRPCAGGRTTIPTITTTIHPMRWLWGTRPAGRVGARRLQQHPTHPAAGTAAPQGLVRGIALLVPGHARTTLSNPSVGRVGGTFKTFNVPTFKRCRGWVENPKSEIRNGRAGGIPNS